MAIARRSVKREAMLSLLRSVDCHPSAEWVYERMRRDYPDISLGTVYRNLRQLEGEGLIISVGVVNGQERFDGNTAPHGHFVCSGCGAVMDVEVPEDDGVTAYAERALGVRVRGRDVRLWGTCRECAGEDMRA